MMCRNFSSVAQCVVLGLMRKKKKWPVDIMVYLPFMGLLGCYMWPAAEEFH